MFSPFQRCGRRRAPRRAARPGRRGGVALVALTLSLAVAGCATSKLDTSRAATKISAALQSSYPDLHVGTTTCPHHVTLGSGRSFRCEVPVQSKTVHVVVTQTDGNGKVRFRTEEYLLQPDVVAAYVKRSTEATLARRDHVDASAVSEVSVNCGTERLVLVAKPGRFTCNVATRSGSYTEVATVAADGSVTYSVPNPPASPR